MKPCAGVRKLVSRALDQDLDLAEGERLQAHLAGCEACRAFQRDLAETHRQVRGLEAVEPPPWMAARIMARVRAEAPPEAGFWRGAILPLLRRPQFQAATVLLVCATGYVLLRTPGRPSRDPQLKEERPAPTAVEDRPVAPAPVQGRPREPIPPVPFRDQAAPRKDEGGFAPPPAQEAPARDQAEPPRAQPAPAPQPLPALGASGKASPEAREERQVHPARKTAAPAPAQSQSQAPALAEANQAQAPGTGQQLVFWEPRDPDTAERQLGQILAELGADLAPDPSRERPDALQGQARARTLSARLEARRLPELLARLGRLGTVRAPRIPQQGPDALTVQIQWTGQKRE